MSLNTVKWYNRQIYSKLGLSRQTHLPPFRTKRVLFPVPRISDKAEQEEAGRSCADIIVETLAACFGQSPVLEAYSEAIGVGIVLMQATPSPVVELNRAVAVAMRDGPLAGLSLLDAILARGELAEYHLAHATRAELCRRLGRTAEARDSYQRALSVAQQGPEAIRISRRPKQDPAPEQEERGLCFRAVPCHYKSKQYRCVLLIRTPRDGFPRSGSKIWAKGRP